MSRLLLDTYRFLFARNFFYKFNKFLYKCSLSGLGVLNYQNDKISGEDFFLNFISDKNKKPLVFDVGANIGSYTKNILSKFPESKIYLFEPHPKTFISLIENLSQFNNLTMINTALGDQCSILKLYDYKGKASTHASLYRQVIEDVHHGESESYEVNVITLDDFVNNNNIQHIDLLKIDVEGHELGVLHGANNTILDNKISIIHFEFNEMNVVSHSFMKDFMEILSDFKFYRLLPNGFLPLLDKSPIMVEIFAYQNIIAIHKSKNIF